jgi:hypothetical protein
MAWQLTHDGFCRRFGVGAMTAAEGARKRKLLREAAGKQRA